MLATDEDGLQAYLNLLDTHDLDRFAAQLAPDVEYVSKHYMASGYDDVLELLRRFYGKPPEPDRGGWNAIGAEWHDATKQVRLVYSASRDGTVNGTDHVSVENGKITKIYSHSARATSRTGNLLWYAPGGGPPDEAIIKAAEFQVAFGACENGQITLTLHEACGTLERALIDCTDPFPKLLRWLEAMVIGVERAEIAIWGSDLFRLRAESGTRTVRITSVRNWGDPVLFDTTLPRRYAISTIYQAFRDYVEGPHYNASEWEAATVGTRLTRAAQQCAHGDDVMSFAVGLPRADLVRAFAGTWGWQDSGDQMIDIRRRLMSAAGADPKPDFLKVPDDYDSWSVERRKSVLTKHWPTAVTDRHGHGLRELKSKLVEDYLAGEPQAPASQHAAAA